MLCDWFETFKGVGVGVGEKMASLVKGSKAVGKNNICRKVGKC
jgi:hypothetical protein